MGPGEIVTGGSLLIALPIAVLAGLLSFVSPCVLPLVPGYLGYVSGTTDASRGRTVLGAGLFVMGFSAVFLTVFVLAGTVGVFVLEYRAVVERIAGAVVILLGLVFIGQVTVLQRSLRPTWRPATGLIGAPFLGAVFAVGWTPCIGPTIGAVIALANYEGGDPGRAAIIGAFYCLGLGIPFLLVALGFGWVGGSVAWVKRHIRMLNVIGGGMLVAVGILMVTGIWGIFLTETMAVINGGFVTAF